MFSLKCKIDEKQMQEMTDKAAIKAANMVVNRMYVQVGKGVVHRVLYIIGASSVALVAWLHNRGLL